MADSTLEYFGRAMSPVTYEGQTPAMVAEVLAWVRYACVHLEPGDGTRYDLHVIYRPHEPEWLLIVRDSGGPPAAACVPAWMCDFDLDPLTNGNDWTRQVLRWWLGLLFEALRAHAPPGDDAVLRGSAPATPGGNEPTFAQTNAVMEVLARMGLAADWPALHLRATASLCVRAAALRGSAPAQNELVEFFREEERAWGLKGDYEGWSIERAAIELIHQLRAGRAEPREPTEAVRRMQAKAAGACSAWWYEPPACGVCTWCRAASGLRLAPWGMADPDAVIAG